MKNLLIAVACLAGAALLYVFVIKPLLAPKEQPKDALGNAIAGGINTATGLVNDVISAPGKILHTVGSVVVGTGHAVTSAVSAVGGLFSDGGINCSVPQSGANSAYCRDRYPNVDRTALDGYAQPVAVTSTAEGRAAAAGMQAATGGNAKLAAALGSRFIPSGYFPGQAHA